MKRFLARSRAIRTGACVAVAAVAALLPAAAHATNQSASLFNRTFDTSYGPISDCYQTNDLNSIAGFALNGDYLSLIDETPEPGLDTKHDYCGLGYLRTLRLQTLTVDGRVTYVNRGGGTDTESGLVRQPTTHVSASDIIGESLLPTAARNGNGSAPASCAGSVVYARADLVEQSKLDAMSYKKKTNENGDRGSVWGNYGNPGSRFGTTYNYILWNLPRTPSGLLPGGGIVEAVVKPGHAVRLCEVDALWLPGYALDSNGLATDTQNGYVVFAYGRAHSDSGSTIYGWLLLGYSYNGGPFHATATS